MMDRLSAHLLSLLVLVLQVTVSAGCDLSVVEGTDEYRLHLHEKTLSDKTEIEWKHNSELIFKRKNTKITRGKADDITETGALVLRQLTFKHEGTYYGEVFSEEGHNEMKKTVTLCVRARVPKPTVTFKCSEKDVSFNCLTNLTKKPGLIFAWRQNKDIIKGETSPTLKMGMKNLRKDAVFSCTVDDTFSNETSDGIKSTCEVIPDSSSSWTLFGLSFWMTVVVLAGGGGLVLILIIITAVCCYHSHSRSREDEEAEFRLAPLTQPQPQPCHKDPAHRHKHPQDARQPFPCTGAPLQATAQPRAQVRARPVLSPQDEEDTPPPLPHPRRSAPRPIHH